MSGYLPAIRRINPNDPYGPPTDSGWGPGGDPSSTYQSGDPTSDQASSSNDPYLPALASAAQRLSSAYDTPHAGMARQIIGGLFTHHPGIGAAISGEGPRNQKIQQAQDQYQLLANIVQQNRAAQTFGLTSADTASQIGQRKAMTDWYNTRANNVDTPKPTVDEQVFQGYLKKNNGDAVAAHQDMLDDLNDAKPAKATPARINYDSGIPVSITGTDGTTHDVNDPNMPPELKPLVTSANAAHQQRIKEEADQQARSFAQQNTLAANKGAAKASNDEQKRSDLADNLNENLDKLDEIATRRPDLFGPISGRISSLRGTIGTSDPDIATLDSLKEQIGIVLQSAHGMRSAQGVTQAATSVLNNFRNSAGATLAASKAARDSVETFRKDVDQPGTHGGTQPAKSSSGAAPPSQAASTDPFARFGGKAHP